MVAIDPKTIRPTDARKIYESLVAEGLQGSILAEVLDKRAEERCLIADHMNYISCPAQADDYKAVASALQSLAQQLRGESQN